ncbi:hypothetical protein [Corallococcus sp. AB030]|uniref:hypothetical protein n=1 Tax=Corallococcus sp. AB030 TaxID=2316716 RepID=UPI0011E5CF5D|nr:hypothetical protein [Corallococcus sp. AB030]
MQVKIRSSLFFLSATCLLVIGGCGTEGQEAETEVSNGSVQQAAGNPCGAGYSLIDTYPMKNSNGAVKGHYNLYYNGTRNCGVAECYTNCGVTMNRVAFIRVSSSGPGDWDDVDTGQFATYAGPVYSKPSAGKCLDLLAYFGFEASVASVGVMRVHCN